MEAANLTKRHHAVRQDKLQDSMNRLCMLSIFRWKYSQFQVIKLETSRVLGAAFVVRACLQLASVYVQACGYAQIYYLYTMQRLDAQLGPVTAQSYPDSKGIPDSCL